MKDAIIVSTFCFHNSSDTFWCHLCSHSRTLWINYSSFTISGCLNPYAVKICSSLNANTIFHKPTAFSFYIQRALYTPLYHSNTSGASWERKKTKQSSSGWVPTVSEVNVVSALLCAQCDNVLIVIAEH